MTVYFAAPKSRRAVKIGFTAGDPKTRISTLQTGNHEPLDLLASVPGTEDDEHGFHLRWAAHRLEGEWFRPVDEIKAFIVASGGENFEVTEARVPIETPRSHLVGKFAHNFKNGLVHNQFQILSVQGEEVVVQFFSWIDGFASSRGILKRSDAEAWHLYDDEGSWRENGDRLNEIAYRKEVR